MMANKATWSLLLLLSSSVLANIDMPFWPQYPTRTSTLLNGNWSFGYQADLPDVINFPSSKAMTPNTTVVPSAFDVAQPGVAGPRGTAFYRRNFELKANTPGLLYFAACSFYCQVFVDGQSLGDHRAGGYQPFWITVPASSQETRELLVLVDNRFNSTTAPTHTGGDFWHYGGLTRDVILHEQPGTSYLDRVETFTLDTNGNIKVNVVLGGQSGASTVDVKLQFDDGDVTSHTLSVKDNVATLETIQVPNYKLWSIAEPNLHTLTVSEADGPDAIQVRFGLRVLGVEGGRLTINGDTVKLHGHNRHTMRPDTGSALTLEQVQDDIAILKQLNANYVRGAHYPQDQRFLDLCDEHGIVIWEETLGPGVSTDDLQNPYFMKYQVEAVNEMITASINHPCVIFHGFYNEGPSSDLKACPGYNTSAATIRSRVGSPPTRLVTWASDKKVKDVCLGITDVISFNSYPAWYDHPGNLNETSIFWASQVEWVQQHYPSKPFTISETGAGGVYEWTNSTDPRWSQNYQAEVVGRDIKFALGSDRVTGITIWQFNDIKANDGDTAKCPSCDYKPHPASLSQPWDCAFIDVTCGRPGGENHKGAVDFWRRTKLAFRVAAELYGNVTAQL
eukprot:m.229236 g.229236  ORF g.229236 m.229236 type:complete len:619 (-) comp17334_c0_seq13:95-1951(-)